MSKHNIVVATDLTEESLQILKDADDVDVYIVPPKTATVRSALATAHAIITRDDFQLDAALLEHAPNLKLIGRVSADLNGLDIETASTRGILIMNTPGTSSIAAGELTISLMLALSRKLLPAHNSTRDGWWLLDRKKQEGTQLYRKTLGIVGLGRRGLVVANRALAFGMTILAYDPYIREEQVSDQRIALVSFDDLLARSDYITLHVPATHETNLMFDEDTIVQMKPGSRLINTAHGCLVDEKGLAFAIKEGHLAGAGVDVYHEEPPFNSPLIGMDNIIHTPHIGDNTAEARQDLSAQIVHQVLDALRDKDYRNVVNMPLIPGTDFEHLRPYLYLAEQMGTILHSLSRSPIERIAIELQGEELNGLVKSITVGILKGLLTPFLGEKVSYVNAPILATERGWHITQAKGLRQGEYSNVVNCQIILEDGEEITITGTLMDHKEPYIVQINQYRMNFVPRGHLLILGSFDTPGVIGKIGMLMADSNINIGSWQTGRAEPGGNTLTVIALDEAIRDEVMQKLNDQDFVRHAHQIYL